MKKSDLEFLIDSYLFKLQETCNQLQMFAAIEIARRHLGMFLDWCISNNLLDDSESNCI